MGFSIIMIANLFLIWVNSFEFDSIFKSMKRLAKDKVMWAVNIGTIGGLLLMLYTPLAGILSMTPLSPNQLFMVIGIAAVSVLCYELVKPFKKRV